MEVFPLAARLVRIDYISLECFVRVHIKWQITLYRGAIFMPAWPNVWGEIWLFTSCPPCTYKYAENRKRIGSATPDEYITRPSIYLSFPIVSIPLQLLFFLRGIRHTSDWSIKVSLLAWKPNKAKLNISIRFKSRSRAANKLQRSSLPDFVQWSLIIVLRQSRYVLRRFPIIPGSSYSYSSEPCQCHRAIGN